MEKGKEVEEERIELDGWGYRIPLITIIIVIIPSSPYSTSYLWKNPSFTRNPFFRVGFKKPVNLCSRNPLLLRFHHGVTDWGKKEVNLLINCNSQ